MLQQMAGLSLHYPPRTISVLAFLLLAHSCRGQSQLFGAPKPIVATVGDDIILPCHLKPTEDVAAKTLEWTRPNLNPRFVFVWRAGQDLENVKNPSYKGRTSLFPDELKQGNMSLKLSKVNPSDAGRYKCYIPDMNIDSFIELVVGAVSLPIISLAGIDRDKGGLVLQCESEDWYPEPEVLWLDGEGNLLSAGPTETVRGPDDLYTVSSRVTVEKSHNNRFTCRVQQKDTNQTRETEIHVTDDFFEVQSSFSVPINTGLAVSLAVSVILFILLLLFSVWKWRQNKINTKISHRDGTDPSVTAEEAEALTGKNEKEIKLVDELSAKVKEPKKEKQRREDELQQLQRELEIKKDREQGVTTQLKNTNEELKEAKQELKSRNEEISTLKREQQQRREEAERENRTLKEELETMKKEINLKRFSKLTLEKKQQKKKEAEKQDQTKKLDDKNKELEERTISEPGDSQDVQVIDTCLTNQDSAKGCIIVDEIASEGNFVRLRNNSKEDKPLKGWELHLQINNRKPSMFKSFDSFILKTGETVTIWASGCRVNDNPPTDLVWRNQTCWGTREQLLVSLYSCNGELEASKTLEHEESQGQLSRQTCQDSAKGHVIVDEVDPEGIYVHLLNTSNKDQMLSGCELHLRVNNRKPIIYTFSNFSLKPGDTFNVECSEKCWTTGDQLLVSLYNYVGKEMATKKVGF